MKKRLCTVACAAALALSACAGDGDDSISAGTVELILTAEIDVEHSTVKLPGDAYIPSEWETGQMLSAQNAAVAVCARENLGITWEAERRPEEPTPESLMFTVLGPWTRDMADNYGFAIPSSRESLIQKGFMPPPEGYKPSSRSSANESFTQEQHDLVIEECGETPEVQQFDLSSLGFYDGRWVQELNETQGDTMKDARVLVVIDELKECGSEQGLTITDTEGEGGTFPVAVEGADPGAINEEQIALANQYVTCMEETDAVKRVTNVWAEKQAHVIEKYPREFATQRETIDDTVADAEAYIAEHEEVFSEGQD